MFPLIQYIHQGWLFEVLFHIISIYGFTLGTKIATLKTQKLWDGIILELVFHTDIILLIGLMTVMRRRLTIADVQTLVVFCNSFHKCLFTKIFTVNN